MKLNIEKVSSKSSRMITEGQTLVYYSVYIYTHAAYDVYTFTYMHEYIYV